MAESEEACMKDIGQHCSHLECKRLDFLPFRCEKCTKIFCQNHRVPSHHQCSNASDGSVVIPTCPLCRQPIDFRRSQGQSVNDQVEKHIISGCTALVLAQPSDRGTRQRSSRCAYHHCRTIPLVPFWCGDCRKNFCVRHRSTFDHRCSPVAYTPPVTCH